MFGIKVAATALEEIVFENRNKLYGAYWLRTHYYENVLRGLSTSISFIVVALFMYTGYRFWVPVREVTSVGREVVLEVTLPAKILEAQAPAQKAKPITEAPKPPQGVQKASTAFLLPEFTPEEGENPPNLDVFKDKNPGSTTQEGDSTAGLYETEGTPDGSPNAGTNSSSPFGSEANAEIFSFAEVMPEARYDLPTFIARHTVYPDVDVRNEISGTVVIGFVVDSDGKVTQVKVLKGISPTADAAAVHAVEQLPPFTPGRQGNKPVRVRMTVPVRFILN
jgi:protein TonB